MAEVPPYAQGPPQPQSYSNVPYSQAPDPSYPSNIISPPPQTDYSQYPPPPMEQGINPSVQPIPPSAPTLIQEKANLSVAVTEQGAPIDGEPPQANSHAKNNRFLGLPITKKKFLSLLGALIVIIIVAAVGGGVGGKKKKKPSHSSSSSSSKPSSSRKSNNNEPTPTYSYASFSGSDSPTFTTDADALALSTGYNAFVLTMATAAPASDALCDYLTSHLSFTTTTGPYISGSPSEYTAYFDVPGITSHFPVTGVPDIVSNGWDFETDGDVTFLGCPMQAIEDWDLFSDGSAKLTMAFILDDDCAPVGSSDNLTAADTCQIEWVST